MLIKEYDLLDFHEIVERYPCPATLATKGNDRLGPITSFSGMPGKAKTCPGATEVCVQVCDNKHSAKIVLGNEKGVVKAAWYSHLAATNVVVFYEKINYDVWSCGTSAIQIHVGGDFFTKDQIDAWQEVVEEYPNKSFFSQTRSWRIPALRPYLEMLKALPNMTLIASTDSETGEGPEGWSLIPLPSTEEIEMKSN